MDAKPGNIIAIADGLVKVKVLEVSGEEVVCEAITPGNISKGRGVNVAGVIPTGDFLNETTDIAIRFAVEHNADFIAISSVGSASHVESIKEQISEHDINPAIISKIETAEGIRQFKSILGVSDGIMVARGDMGVEIDLSEVPTTQKQLIRASNIAGKPVITGLPAIFEALISCFCVVGTSDRSISTPMSPRATIIPSDTPRIDLNCRIPSAVSIFDMIAGLISCSEICSLIDST